MNWERLTSDTFTKAELIKALEMFDDDEKIFILGNGPVKNGIYQVNLAVNHECKKRCEICVAPYREPERRKVSDEREISINR